MAHATIEAFPGGVFIKVTPDLSAFRSATETDIVDLMIGAHFGELSATRWAEYATTLLENFTILPK